MFDENLLNCSQFVQLVESFLGMSTPEEVVQQVIKYLGEGYVETEEEKYLRLQKVTTFIKNFVVNRNWFEPIASRAQVHKASQTENFAQYFLSRL